MLRKLCLFSIKQTFIICLFILGVSAIQSRWGYTYNKTTGRQYSIFPNYLYKGASVTVTILCHSKDEDVHVKVDWLLQEVDCMEQIYKVDMKSDLAVIGILDTMSSFNGTKTSNYSEKLPPGDESEYPYYIASFPENMNVKDILFEEIEITKKEKSGKASKKNKMIFHEVTRAWEDGMYHMLLTVSSTNPEADFEATGIVEMHGRYGFLSAIDWPLLPYNSVMAFLYLILATVWIVIWARSHKHTLKIHVVMGFIAVAGAMCHTLQFIEHAAVNSNGGGVANLELSVKGLLWFARVLVSAQISVLYLILMIVSTGYGITSYAFAPLGDGDDDEMDEFLAEDDEEDSDVEEFNMEKTKIRLEPL